MTPAEAKFKNIVALFMEQRRIPGPTTLNELIHGHRSRNLNGRETRWRREVFEQYGCILDRSHGHAGSPGRWRFMTEQELEEARYSAV